MSKRVLLVGWEPSVVDFSKVPGLDLNEEKLRRQLTADRDRLMAAGYEVDWCYLDSGETAERMVNEALQAKDYDCVMVGAGVRLPPDYLLTFEKLVNLIHRNAPNAHLCFNSNPADTAVAVQRWI